MKNLIKGIASLVLLANILACEESANFHQAENLDSKVSGSNIETTTIPPERIAIKVALLEAEVNKSKEIVLDVQHDDNQVVQYDLAIGACTKSIPAKCEAEIKATSIFQPSANQLVEKELRFDGKKYIQKRINVLNITDSFGNVKTVKIEDAYQLTELDLNIIDVSVDQRKGIFTVSAYLQGDTCALTQGDLQLRNYLTPKLEQANVRSKSVAYQELNSEYRKMKAVLVTKQKIDNGGEVLLTKKPPIACLAVVMPHKKTFKFSEFGITMKKGLQLIDSEGLAAEFKSEGKEIPPVSDLATAQFAELSRDKSSLVVNFLINDFNPQLRNIICTDMPQILRAQSDERISILPRATDCKGQFVNEQFRTTRVAGISPVADKRMNQRTFTAKSLGLYTPGSRIQIEHKEGLMIIQLLKNNTLELIQALN